MSEPAQRVVLLRHGQTEWSRTGRHTGRSDIPLDAVGEQQALAGGDLLRGSRFAAVLTSPLRRARETARLAGLAVTGVRDDLAEWDYGDDEGRTTTEIRADRPGWVLWDDGCPNGEDAAAVGARVDRVIDEVRAVAGDVALVAHGHLLRVLAARWCGLPPGHGRLLRLDTATISALGYEHAQAVITLWNEGPHLRAT